MPAESNQGLETATLGGGCFWCMEAVFDQIQGVINVQSGYSGGEMENPTYEEVCRGRTGHAEVVQVTYDPAVISYEEILRIFFDAHDPTTPDRQGNDVGPQYRSIILYHDDAQRAAAEKMVRSLNLQNAHGAPVVTEIKPFKAFYRAERYHDDYFRRNRGQSYCRLVIAPKVSKARDHFRDKLKG